MNRHESTVQVSSAIHQSFCCVREWLNGKAQPQGGDSIETVLTAALGLLGKASTCLHPDNLQLVRLKFAMTQLLAQPQYEVRSENCNTHNTYLQSNERARTTRVSLLTELLAHDEHVFGVDSSETEDALARVVLARLDCATVHHGHTKADKAARRALRILVDRLRCLQVNLYGQRQARLAMRMRFGVENAKRVETYV